MGTNVGCLFVTLSALEISMQMCQGQNLCMFSGLYSTCKEGYFLGFCLIEIKINVIGQSYNIFVQHLYCIMSGILND